MGYRDELDTPCLVVYEDVLRQNIDEMAVFARDHGVALRPHQKTHKTAEIARMQMAAGAVGGTCAKIGEAEALIDAGAFNDVLFAYQVVGTHKYRRLFALSERATVTVALDGLESASLLSQACQGAGKEINVLVEVDTGQRRAGSLPGEPTLALAREISQMPGLRFRGVMTHEGHVAKAKTLEELDSIAQQAGRDLVDTAELLRRNGVPVEVVSVGSTPAAFHTPKVPGITEMRPGTYVFNDNATFRFGRITPERCALRILATVISRPSADRAIIDAGSKTLAVDASASRPGHGYVVEIPDATIVRLSEEHGVIELPESARDLAVGSQLEVIPNHVCPTVNLQDEMFIVRDGDVVDRWDIVARGKVR